MNNTSYTWNAEGYANHSSPQHEWGTELFNKLKLEGNERLLNIGCGDGKITIKIAGSLPEGSVVGIDNSGEMIKLARTIYPEENFPNVRFLQADARNLPFDGEFDVVFSNATLHWIQNHSPVLQGINRSLRSDGKILLQMGGKGNGAELIRVADELIKSRRWEKYFETFSFSFAFHTPELYQRWLNKAGLQPIRTELIPKTIIHDSPDALLAWLEKVFIPYLEHIPEAKRRHFLNDLIEKYIEQHPVDEHGRTHLQMVRLEVEANKEKE